MAEKDEYIREAYEDSEKTEPGRAETAGVRSKAESDPGS